MAQTRKRPYCKPCRNAQERSYYDPQKDRNRHLKYWYGIDQLEYERMFAEQGGQCAICARKPHKLCIDHDHKTGAVRNLLCHPCNTMVGRLEKIPGLAERAVEYIKYHGD